MGILQIFRHKVLPGSSGFTTMIRTCIPFFLLLPVIAAQPAVVTVSGDETWNGINNPHITQGVTLSGSGSVSDPFVYTIPEGMTITSTGIIRLSTAKDFIFRFQTGGLVIQNGGRLDLNKGADRLGSFQFTLDMGGHDITGQGQLITSGRGTHQVEIKNVHDVVLRAIALRRDDASAAPVTISSSGTVVIPGGIDLTDGSLGGNQGGDLNIQAECIEVGPISTGSRRTASATLNGTIKLVALAYPNFDPNDVSENSVKNTIHLGGRIDTTGALAEHSGGNVYLQAVKIVLAPAFQVVLPDLATAYLKAGVSQGPYSVSDLFTDQVPGGSGLSASHVVRWSLPGFRVKSTQPGNGAELPAYPDEIRVHFSEPVKVSSLASADFVVDGASATSFRVISDSFVSFSISSIQPIEGYHTVTIAEGVMESVDEQPIEPYRGGFRILISPTLINQGIRKVGSYGVNLGAEVTQSPQLRAYYGLEDGGTNIDQWEACRFLGEFQDGSIEATLYGLRPQTSYYCRLLASNAVGETWATETLQFETLPSQSLYDPFTLALWLFDETQYPSTTVTDAGPGQYDLRLSENGRLEPGRFGNALRNLPGTDFGVHFSGWKGILCATKMAAPPYIPSGLWGPTIAPVNLLTVLAGQDWTLELWIRLLSLPGVESAVFHLGDAYDPGLALSLIPGENAFRVENAYAGTVAVCPTRFDVLGDGEWHHVAFTRVASGGQMVHFLDGIPQNLPTLSSTSIQSIPPLVIPASLANTDYGIFDASRDYEKFRQNRFNLSLGEDRHGANDLHALFDEVRFSSRIRYVDSFTLPDSFSRTHQAIAPPPSQANGLPLLFGLNASPGPLRLGTRKHLFIDESIIESKHNVKLTVNPPTNPQLTNIHFGGDFSTVDYNGKIHLIIPDGYASDEGITRLYTSTDGLRFISPDLGVVEYHGSTSNNIILSLSPMWACAFDDPNPDVFSEDRFKLTAWLANAGIYLYTSPDLIHWQRNETLMLPLVSGGGVETFWDDQNGVYRNYLKRDPNMNSVACTRSGGRTGVGFETREVLKSWPFQTIDPAFFEYWSIPNVTCEGPVVFPVNENGEVYRTRAIKYPWAPDVYLAFAWRFDANQVRQTDLFVSRDGETWTPLGDIGMYMPSGGMFYGRTIVERLCQYGMIRRGDEIWQYAEYNTGPHGQGESFSVRVKQRLDGFTSLDAGAATGTITTHPLIFDGNRLTLNVAPQGLVKVALLDQTGAPFPGFSMTDCDPIAIDSTNMPVSWNGSIDIGPLSGQTVKISFEMTQAKLFAFQFDEVPVQTTPTPTFTPDTQPTLTPTPQEVPSGVSYWHQGR